MRSTCSLRTEHASDQTWCSSLEHSYRKGSSLLQPHLSSVVSIKTLQSLRIWLEPSMEKYYLERFYSKHQKGIRVSVK